MSRLILILKLCRFPNLLMVFLSQAIPYFAVILPALNKGGAISNLDRLTFSLLTIGTVLTTLGGYLINDIFDQKIDAINKPNRQIVGKHFSEQKISVIYYFVVVFTLVIALLLDLHLPDNPSFWHVRFYGTVSMILYLYARILKCTPILGNLFVATLCAVVPLMFLMPEKRPLHILGTQDSMLLSKIHFTLYFYAFFAFLTSLYREIVKDMEDVIGDSACKCRTLPVLKGIRVTKKWALLVGTILTFSIGMLLYSWHEQGQQHLKIGIGFATMAIPSIISLFILIKTNQKEGFHTVSNLIKVVMLAGLLLLGWL
jgi:4-hydroxybenzoate polyprenyltransferase